MFKYIGSGFIQNMQGTCLLVDFERSEVGGKPFVDCSFYCNNLCIVCHDMFATIQMTNEYSLHLIQVYNRKLGPKKCEDGSSPIVSASNCNGDMTLRPCLADATGKQINNAFAKNWILGDRISINGICLNVGSNQEGRVKEDGQIRF